MKKLAFVIFFVFLCSCLFPQSRNNSISGFIIDKTTGEPLPDVNIFVSGTNSGITSSENGYYEIKNLREGRQKLTFSLIGYESATVILDIAESFNIKYNTELLPRIYSTETIEVKSERPLDRTALLSRFRERFLGIKESNPNGAIIEDESKIFINKINSDVVRFRSDTLLTVVNNFLGYNLEGRLDYFNYNTATKEYSYYFKPAFREIPPNSTALKQQWEENRRRAYRGSLRHFLKALFNNSTSREGFQVYISSPELAESRPEELKDLSSITSPKSIDEKFLHFRGQLIIRYGLEISSIRMRKPQVILKQTGHVEDDSPFDLSGSFVSGGVLKMLPDSYNPARTAAVKSGEKPGMNEEMSAFMDTLQHFKGRKYEALKDSLLRLTFKHPDNILDKLKYALTLEKCCIVSAENEYKEAAEKDTSCAEAYFRLGKIQADEFNEYRTSVKKMDVPSYVYDALYGDDTEPDPSTMLGSMKSVSTDMFLDAEASFRKAIALDKGPDEYFLALAFLYEDNTEYAKAVDLLKELVRKNPENMNAHLFLGMLYFRTRANKKSHSEYEEAMSMMSADEKNNFMFTSVKMLLQPAGLKDFDKLDDITLSELIKKFWMTEDPLLLTGHNERLLEHYSRVAYANLRFSDRKKTKPGWMTERGEILVRYGFPKSVVRFRPYVEFEYRLTTYAKTEVWYYGDMVFSFSDRFLTGEYPLNTPMSAYVKSQFETDSREFAGKLKKEMFERYDFAPEGENLPGAFRIYQFKSFSGLPSRKTDVYMGLLVPGADLPGSEKKNLYKWGLYCFDSKYNMIESRMDSLVTFIGENILSVSGKQMGAVMVHSITGYPGNLNIAGEVLRHPDNSAFSSHKRVSAKDFSSESRLMLSDIVISPKVLFGSGSQSAINRSGIWLLPDPAQVFTSGDSVHIYYEVYNLGRNARGINDYSQEITISRKDENSGSVFGQIVSGAVKFFKSKDEAQNIQRGAKLISRSKNQQMIFQTNFSTLEKGEYTLHIKLKDKITGQSAETETAFTIK